MKDKIYERDKKVWDKKCTIKLLFNLFCKGGGGKNVQLKGVGGECLRKMGGLICIISIHPFILVALLNEDYLRYMYNMYINID